ncbi:MAG: hypothetical protein U5K76_10305 [Woeseiaceae bacterium]|nr:hypothetical protein [Woeseiaceae bacterium]
MGRLVRIALIVLAVAAATGFVTFALLWQSRGRPDDIPLPVAAPAADTTDKVTVTWLGITTLLFDDGETQLITDGTFSRVGITALATGRAIESDIAQINYALDEFHVHRLAAIIPVHSHFDHVMDAGHVANRTGAVILGSESTANVARGSRVPVDRYQILQFGESRYFGDFTVTLIESRHVPQLPGGEHLFPGIIDSPLEQPAPVGAWQSGAVYSVVVSHPAGTVLVQGSAGYLEGALDDVEADVALLSIAGLTTMGREYTAEYWHETVEATGATRVYPVHFDDFTQAFGELALFPDLVDDVVTSSEWLRQLAAEADAPITVQRPPLGQPIVLF